MSELNTALPSIRQIQSFIKDKQTVTIKLLTNEVLDGIILWQDQNCLCLVDETEQSTLVWRQALAYVKAVVGE